MIIKYEVYSRAKLKFADALSRDRRIIRMRRGGDGYSNTEGGIGGDR